MQIKAKKYAECVPPLDSLRDTDIYQIAEKIARNIKPTRQEIACVVAEIKQQQVNPTALVFRGWLFDFTPICPQKSSQLSIF